MRFLALILTAATLFAAEPNENDQYVKKGEEVAANLRGELASKLKTKILLDGAAQAIPFCSKNALELTAQATKTTGVISVKRTSDKIRNQKNRADAKDLEAIAHLAKSKEPYYLIKNSAAKTVSFYKPLLIQGVCLSCHGNEKNIPEDVKKQLAALYPQDLATGYALGDLRGVIRVDMPYK